MKKNTTLTLTIARLFNRTAKYRPASQVAFMAEKLALIRAYEILFPTLGIWEALEEDVEMNNPISGMLGTLDELEQDSAKLILHTLCRWDDTTVAPGEDGWPVAGTPAAGGIPINLSPAQARAFKKLTGVSWKDFIKKSFKEQRKILNADNESF